MKHFTSILLCILAVALAHAQFIGPGYYRVHNVKTDSYITIKGTHFEKSINPDAFWACVKMQQDSDQVVDPGSIIYIPGTTQVGLHAQGVDTYSLTGLFMDIEQAPALDNGMVSYIARTEYDSLKCVFRDYGNGLTAGSSTRKPESHWWIEPVNEGSMDTSYFAVKPQATAVADSAGYYWATLCCDFPFLIPVDGGVEGAYTIQQVTMGDDSLYYAIPVKAYGQGDTVKAAMPVLLRCKSLCASDNKLVPVGALANCVAMPITHDMLMGNYFSDFINHADLKDYSLTAQYIPTQATPARPDYLALDCDEQGRPIFVPRQEGTYMDANTAWLDMSTIKAGGITTVYLAPVKEAGNDTIDPGDDPQPQVLYGDTNGDNVIDVDDVTLLISMVLGLPAPGTTPEIALASHQGVNLAACDVDQNGAVDIDDVTALIRMLLSSSEDE